MLAPGQGFAPCLVTSNRSTVADSNLMLCIEVDLTPFSDSHLLIQHTVTRSYPKRCDSHLPER